MPDAENEMPYEKLIFFLKSYPCYRHGSHVNKQNNRPTDEDRHCHWLCNNCSLSQFKRRLIVEANAHKMSCYYTSYQLRCQLFGHEKDVRAVTAAIFPENGIVSGSRDVTARVWVPNEGDNSFHEGLCISGHSNYISSVCCMPPDDKYPQGLIYTGSNDSTILAFTLDSPQAVFKLTGHTSTVCSLAAGKFGTLLSGSWDKTARVWLNQKSVMTLEGHEAAVWAVAIMPEQGVMLTGSADQTIKVWKAGRCERTIKGHTDCVRGLAVTQNTEFLSCSNDATIRRWLLSGDCLAVYYGHENFVYSISVLPNGQDFVSSGEDRTVRVWKNGECKQTINHPTLSIWSVCTLANGDIVSGSSDGTVRVFTSDPKKYASTEELKAYDEQISSSQVPSQLGDLKPEDLSGPEALFNPGTKDGQTKMIKDGKGKVELYSWEASTSQWKKVGDVVGSSGGTQATSGKTLFEGQEYDYVFSVDIEEGKPPLKLPYNIAEDPWFAAQNFLYKNDLSQVFLDQVANFIIDNTKGVTLGQGQGAGYSDPFTGAGRYIPGSGAEMATEGSDPFTGSGRYIPGSGATNGPTGGADPFTGGGRYVPTYREEPKPKSVGAGDARARDPITGSSSYHTGTVNPNLDKTNQYFPKDTFLTFDNANPAQIIGKLREFNSNIEPSKKLEESAINSLETMLNGGIATSDSLNHLKSILEWPPNFVFPVLDILRICIKQRETSQAFCASDNILEDMFAYWSPDSSAANQILSLKVVCNMFAQPIGFKLLMDNRDRIIERAMVCKSSKNKNVQIAVSTLILNFSIGLFGSLNLEGKSQCLSAAATLLETKMDPEASFRTLVAMGTLIHKDESLLNLAVSLDIPAMLGSLVNSEDVKKLSECSSLLSQLFT